MGGLVESFTLEQVESFHRDGFLIVEEGCKIARELVDERADVYALGCVLFHALSGEVPFPRPSAPQKLWAHVHDPPPAATIVGNEGPSAPRHPLTTRPTRVRRRRRVRAQTS